MKSKKQWKDLSPAKQRAITVAGALELVLLAVSLVDLVRRPTNGVKGSKGLWGAALFINPVGPICYWMFGRRRTLPSP
jgi:hypothetical protein